MSEWYSSFKIELRQARHRLTEVSLVAILFQNIDHSNERQALSDAHLKVLKFSILKNKTKLIIKA